MRTVVTAICLATGLAMTTVSVSAARQGDVTTAPVLVKDVKPSYPPRALAAKQHGRVLLTLTVKPDGTVGKVRVTEHLSEELDAAAVRAAKQWRFKPGTRNGKPVRVETNAEMTFAFR
jgi:protein TonB